MFTKSFLCLLLLCLLELSFAFNTNRINFYPVLGISFSGEVVILKRFIVRQGGRNINEQKLYDYIKSFIHLCVFFSVQITSFFQILFELLDILPILWYLTHVMTDKIALG